MKELLSMADIEINGNDPWDMQVHHRHLPGRLLAKGSLGLGESYMDGWWDCESLDQFFDRILQADLDTEITSFSEIFDVLKSKLINLQNPLRAFKVGKQHYDIGNELYRYMLDKRLIYTCACWENASTLDEAQEAKLDMICQKLALQPGMNVLDIGCGWGGTAKFIAEHYQATVVGITVSEEQVKFAQHFCRGLPIEIRLQDYRSLEGVFDRVLSLGMFEHVGYKNYRTFFKIVKNCLKEGGRFVLQTNGHDDSLIRTDPWIQRYIFPNSMIPSASQICSGFESLFILEDWHNFGQDYDKTLMQWFKNFDENWFHLKKHYDERFYRMWKYYLLSCAGSFRARKSHLWQIVFCPC